MLKFIYAINLIVLAFSYWKVLRQIDNIKHSRHLLVSTLIIQLISGAFLSDNGLIAQWIFYYLFLRYKEGKDNLNSRFFSSYTVFIVACFSMFSRLTSYFIYSTFLVGIPSNYSKMLFWIIIIALNLLIPTVHKFIYEKTSMKDIQFNLFSEFVRDDILSPSVNILHFGLGILIVSYLINHKNGVEVGIPVVKETRIHAFITFFIIVFVFFFIDSRARLYNEKVNEMRRKQQIDDMHLYINEIEQMNQKIRGYRHDMNNIFLSLKGAIEKEDISSIRKIYEDVIQDAEHELATSDSSIQELAYIENDALKSIVASKVFSSQQAGLEINIALIEPINDLYIEQVDYLRIVSILLDNAIEAASLLDNGFVNFTFIYSGEDELTFVVENNFSKDYIASTYVDELFQEGVTSNADGRGVGLSNIKLLQDKYPSEHLTVTTFIQDDVFTQTVITKAS